MSRALPLLVLALGLFASPASAQDEESPAPSDAHRHLRALERELFTGRGDVGPRSGRAIRAVPAPPVATSEPAPAPATPPAAAAPGGEVDLAWTEGLTLPDLPVRWDARVLRYLAFFRDDRRGRNIIRAWIRRMERYGPVIRETLTEMGLPQDLLFVAMIESGFDPTARSRAGAVGMWQFVEATGEELGLSVDRWVDLRQDPVRATRAAGRYLEQLHDRFGSWELALAAYNMGYGRLLRSIRKYNTNDYWELSHLEAGLPFDTSLYVAKVLACAIVSHNRDRFGLSDLEAEPALRWETVRVRGGTRIGVIARLAGISVDELRTLNPALRRDRLPPDVERFEIRLPAGSGERFAERWSRRTPNDPAVRPRTVRFGEDLAAIAREAGVRIGTLRSLNGLANDERARPGAVLLVPVGAPRRTEAADPPVVSVPAGSPAQIDGRVRAFYRSVRGDRVAEIARFFDVTEAEVVRWNRIDAAAALQSGMVLQLYVPTDFDRSRALLLGADEVRILEVGSEAFYAWHEAQQGRIRFRYTVRSGDTLGTIGRRFDISVGSLCRINQLRRSATLRPGDELVIYADEDRVPASLRPRIAPPTAAVETPSRTAEAPAAAAASETSGEGESPTLEVHL